MKFCKRYEEYMEGKTREKELPRVGIKKLKKTLKRCRRDFQGREQGDQDGKCPHGCQGTWRADAFRRRARAGVVPTSVLLQICDGTFFPSLLKEMSAVVGCFNEQAQSLLELHLTTGFRRYLGWFKSKMQKDHGVLMQQGKDLVTYAIINSVAMRKILKKYDKIHCSKQGQDFRSQAQSMHIELLQSPWLCQLMALHINLRQSTTNKTAISGLFADCSLIFSDDKPMISYGSIDSVKLEIDLTCSICLDTVFDPVSLSCGHIFCYMCCCSAASVTTLDGLRAANPKAKCPLCRQGGVYHGAVHLDELNILLSRSCPDYWEQRIQTERAERLRQAKEHWESKCRAFLGP